MTNFKKQKTKKKRLIWNLCIKKILIVIVIIILGNRVGDTNQSPKIILQNSVYEKNI